jgi:hypothetical protein
MRTKSGHEHMLCVRKFLDLREQSRSGFLDLGSLKRCGAFLASIVNQLLSVGNQHINRV